MNNNIQCSIESSTTKIELNSAVDGVFLVPELEGLVGLPEIRTTSGVNAGYDGGWTSAQNYDARLISIRGVIANPDISKVEDKRRAIASLLGQGRKEQLTLRFTTEAGNAYAISVRTISCEMALQRVLTTQEFLIQLRADDPLIYDDGTTGGIAAILQPQRALGGFEINFGLPLAIGGGAEDTVVDNGNETVYPVIKLYGALHSPTVVNRTTNQQMQILADLQYSIDWHTYRSATGDYILVSDGLNGAPMTLSQLLGNAEQTTYSGKNLLPPTADWTQTVSGVTVTCSNGQYTFSGTSTANGSTTARATIAPYTIQAGDYFHYGNSFASPNINIQLVFTDSTSFATSMNVTNRVLPIDNYNGTSYVGKTISSCRVNFASGFAFNGTVSPMILHNVSTQTDFVPYVGGVDSPNPDYPQPVETVADEQTVQVTGKNLLSITAGSVINAGTYVSGANTSEYKIKATGNDIFVNAAAATGAYYASAIGNLLPCNYGETIYFNVGNNSFQKNFFTEWDGNLVSLGYTAVSSSSGTYTPTRQGCKYVSFRFGNGYPVVDTTYTLSPIVCKTSDTSYESYQGQSYNVNLGKNLIDINSLATTDITVSNGVATGQAQHFYAYYGQNTDGVPFIKKNGQLAISFKAYTDGNASTANTDGLVVRVVYTDGTGAIVIYCKNNETTSVQHTAVTTLGKSVESIQLSYANVGGNIWHISEFQIEGGSQATSYAPYFTPIELAKIGNYQDRIYKEDGKWYIEKQVGKVVFDGSSDESWTLGTTGSLRYPFGIDIVGKGWASSAIDGVMCDTFTLSASSETGIAEQYQFTFRGTSYNNRLWFFCPKSAITGSTSAEILASYKTFLSSHPTTVYYALATPTTTEITDGTLRAQLNFLASLYKGENNISLIGAGAQGEMAISYATDYTVNQDVITIDSQARTITLNGQDVYHLKTSESEFLVLAPGENKLYLTSEVSDDSGYAEVKFKQGYLSI